MPFSLNALSPLPSSMTGDGLRLAAVATENLEHRIREAVTTASLQEFGIQTPPGIGVFLFGSAGRGDYVGAGSDADVFIVGNDNRTQTSRFTVSLSQELAVSGYHLDVPEWNQLSDIFPVWSYGLVERNIVYEARFVTGDAEIQGQFSERREGLCNPRPILESMLFHKFYLPERMRVGSPDEYSRLKYAPGGSRSFIQFYLFCVLCLRGASGGGTNDSRPSVLEAMRHAFSCGALDEVQYTKAVSALSRLLVARHVFGSNPQGVTINPESVVACQAVLAETLDLLWAGLAGILRDTFGRRAAHFLNQLSGRGCELNDEELGDLAAATEPAVRAAAVLVVSTRGLQESHDRFVSAFMPCNDWAVLAAFAASRLSSPYLLNAIAEKIICLPHYGFIARIVAGSPHISEETLRLLADAPQLLEGHREVAQRRVASGKARRISCCT